MRRRNGDVLMPVLACLVFLAIVAWVIYFNMTHTCVRYATEHRTVCVDERPHYCASYAERDVQYCIEWKDDRK